MTKTILVTGGNGVLGSAFKAIESNYPDYEFVFWDSRYDLRTSNTQWYMSTISPDYVIHCAAVSGGVGISANHPATLLRDNVRMDLNVLEAARSCGVEKVIMTLSSGMYPEKTKSDVFIDWAKGINKTNGFIESDIHQGYPHKSNYAYAFAKRLIDPMIKAYRQEYGMNVIGLVPNGIFGENDYFGLEDSNMTAALIRKFYDNKNKWIASTSKIDTGRLTLSNIELWGDGTPLREITYGQDLARAYMWCLENYNSDSAGPNGHEEQIAAGATPILNVGTTEENSVSAIALMIAEEMDVDPDRIKWDTTKPSGPYRKSTNNSRFINLSNLIEGKPFEYTPFKVALQQTILWYKNMMETEPEKIRTGSKIRS